MYVHITPTRPNSDHTWAIRAFWDVWECMRRGMSAKLRTKASRRVLSYANLQAECHWQEWPQEYIRGRARAGYLPFDFSDEQGNAAVYCQAVPHWMEIIRELRYDAIQAELGRWSYTLGAPRADVAPLVNVQVPRPLVVVQKFLCQLVPDSGEPRGWALHADIDAPPASTLLTERESARLDAVFAGQRCMCDLCLKLRKSAEAS